MNRKLLCPRILSACPLWALAGILFLALPARADDAPENSHRMENRFLFVVDTASAMKSRSNGVNEAVLGLIASDMNGQARKGDTIGFWNYSDRLDTDFPMQVWSEARKKDILRDMREHLTALRYQKRARLEKALPEIGKVMANSERLTVIFIYDGSDLLKGTPFDKDINGLQKKYAPEFKESRAPFVTILAARNGTVFDYTINYPGIVVIPETADPLPPPETKAPQPVIAAAPPAPVIAPKPPPPPVEIVLIGSNFHHHATAPVLETAQAAPVVAPVVAPVAAPVPAPVPAPVVKEPVVAAPVAAAVPAPVAAATAEPVASPVAAAPVPAAPVSEPAPAAAVPAVVAASTGQQVALFVIAFSLLTIAVVLVIFLIRRSKGAPSPSLISQSIDRSR